MPRPSRSGHKYVNWHEDSQSWRVQIRGADKREYSRAGFATIELAVAHRDAILKMPDRDRESGVERRCRELAEQRGDRLIKTTSERGFPDRCLLRRGGKPVVFIEFKRPGEEPTELQYHRLSELNKMGYRAVWVDSVEKFKHELDR